MPPCDPAPGYLVLVRDVIPAHVVAAVRHRLEPVDHGDELHLAGLRREAELSAMWQLELETNLREDFTIMENDLCVSAPLSRLLTMFILFSLGGDLA